VLVIHEGRCAFFGLADRAKPYFEELGFECPPRQTTADFLTSVTDPMARSIRQGYEAVAPRTAKDFGRMFAESADATENFEAMAKFEAEIQERNAAQTFRDAVKVGKAKYAAKQSVYTISFLQQVRACTNRQYQVLWGDKAALFMKNFLLIFQAFIIGSLFYNQPATSGAVFTRGGVLL
jgi:ATP-binding cassette, subfamily G (WHITE), member 2, PDR